jgi:hypothetical protein
MTGAATAQVTFQPTDCDFRAVFVISPDVKTITVPSGIGKPSSEIVANLEVMLDGKRNIFRAECMVANVPPVLEEKLLLEDMQTLAQGNNLRNPTVWVEKDVTDGLVGRIRGQLSVGTMTYVMDMHRFFSTRNVFDAWIGSPAGTFPSEGNLIFLKELRRHGKPLN